MICDRCFLRTLRLQSSKHLKQYSTSQLRRAAQQSMADPQSPAPAPQGPGVATSTSAAQPFSTPLPVSPTAHGIDAKSKVQSPVVMSSVPAGMPLKGLNFIKGKSDPLAMEDHEYPDWLWRILEKKKSTEEAAMDADIYSKSRSKRAKAVKRAKKAAAQRPEDQIPKVPLYEQTINLPAGDGTEQGAKDAAEARTELTRAMRTKRRSSIKEDNFLRTMR